MRTVLVLALLAFAMPAYAANHAVQIKGMKFNPSKISVDVQGRGRILRMDRRFSQRWDHLPVRR